MRPVTLNELKDKVKENIYNLLHQREAVSRTLSFTGERDCAEAIEHYCRAFNYLSQIKED